ncbi:transglutaminase domain-containing protein [Streptomyces venezuelae]|uniref:transglutaminase domain-containing protein n=1 Tax=Streptomyces venezuelae TaxID=54571 RepID=UPI00278BBCE8|nr:transglutaminase domain-containing protein [Streptomyces venezuelae]
MTSRLLMPVRPFRTTGPGPVPTAPAAGSAPAAPSAEAAGATRATAILDLAHPRVVAFVGRVRRAADERGATTDRDRLRTAHGIIAATVRPVYSVEDLRRVSRTLRLGRGSCSQRMAVLEAVARSLGVPTRVRGLLVDGAFWYPRFPKLRPFVPEEVLLAWPEFLLDGTWVPIAELFADGGTAAPAPTADGGAPAPMADGGAPVPAPMADAFTNSGAETLFEAVARTTVDWDAPAACAGAAPCDLSAHLRTDLGRFTSRDELFARHGQTLCLPARTLAEPLLGRWNAGAGADPEATPDTDPAPGADPEADPGATASSAA